MDQERRIGSYRLLSVLGAGATGQVWRALDAQDHPVAVKLLRADLSDNPRVVQGFISERTTLERAQGPYVARVRDLIAEGGAVGIVMDLVPGGSLRGLLNRVGTLAAGDVADLGGKVARGLADLHASGIIHRDIKPENVLLERPERPWGPKITDFGIAKAVELGGSSSQRSTSLVGTPAYIAPELFEGDRATAAADVYSLGILMYELLCGITPFAHPNPVSVMRRHADYLPGYPPGMPAALREVIALCLEKTPGARPTAAAVAGRLGELAPTLRDVPALAPLVEPPAVQRVSVSDAQPTMTPGAADQLTVAAPPSTADVNGPSRQAATAADGETRKGRRRGRKVIAVGVAAVVVLVGGGAAWMILGNRSPSHRAAAGATTTSSHQSTTTSSSSGSSATQPPSSSTPTTMPNVVGMSLSDATNALGGLPITEVDVPSQAKSDGTVLSQEPKAGTASPSKVTLQVARQPVVQYLDEMDPVAGFWNDTGSVTMSGTVYPHAFDTFICNGENNRTVSYNLGTYYRTFQATIGEEDSSTSSTDTALVEVFGDGRKLWSQTIQFGKPQAINVDVTKVLRLDLSVTDAACDSSNNSALVAFGNPTLLGLPGEVPSPTSSN